VEIPLNQKKWRSRARREGEKVKNALFSHIQIDSLSFLRARREEISICISPPSTLRQAQSNDVISALHIGSIWSFQPLSSILDGDHPQRMRERRRSCHRIWKTPFVRRWLSAKVLLLFLRVIDSSAMRSQQRRRSPSFGPLIFFPPSPSAMKRRENIGEKSI